MWKLALLGMVCAEFVSQILAKEWSLRGGRLLALSALLGFLAVNVFWLLALRSGSGMSRGVLIFSVSVMLFAVVVGHFYYGEDLTRVHIAGVIFGIISVALLSM